MPLRAPNLRRTIAKQQQQQSQIVFDQVDGCANKNAGLHAESPAAVLARHRLSLCESISAMQ